MLRTLKLITLRMADALGLNAMLLTSRWRRRRLVILCYHGISLEDEHEWGPAMYMTPSLFRTRMEALRRFGCNVLPLSEAIARLYAGSLPPKAVAITFDDGPYDFYRAAWPILREFSLPATVYLTTYYSVNNHPVFDVMLSYLLWKGRGRELNWLEYLPAPVRLDEQGRADAQRRIMNKVRANGATAQEKYALLESLAARCEIDLAALCAKRILHLMTPAEVKELAAAGLDVQLHTHRHRVSRHRDLFLREIDDNRREIASVSPAPAVHFCYPAGLHLPEFTGFLKERGVESATTCDYGLAQRGTDPYLLPRIVDTSNMTAVEFTSWLSGIGSFLPHRTLPLNESQLIEYTPRE